MGKILKGQGLSGLAVGVLMLWGASPAWANYSAIAMGGRGWAK